MRSLVEALVSRLLALLITSLVSTMNAVESATHGGGRDHRGTDNNRPVPPWAEKNDSKDWKNRIRGRTVCTVPGSVTSCVAIAERSPAYASQSAKSCNSRSLPGLPSRTLDADEFPPLISCHFFISRSFRCFSVIVPRGVVS